LGVQVNPIAIKYNKVFVDGYWNSRQESFQGHLFRIMTSWAMVVDIWFMDPVTAHPGETGAAFAQRVQRMIAARAGLKAVDWDGYMKYWRPSEKFIGTRQRTLAGELRRSNVPSTRTSMSEGAEEKEDREGSTSATSSAAGSPAWEAKSTRTSSLAESLGEAADAAVESVQLQGARATGADHPS
jgi:hypothetical protein